MKLTPKTFSLISLVLLLTALVNPTIQVYADSVSVISGPTGTITNGWYTTEPTITVQAYCDDGHNDNGPQTPVVIPLLAAGPDIVTEPSGKYFVQLMSDSDFNLYIVINNGTPNVVHNYTCPYYGYQEMKTPTNVLWQGNIQYDTTVPTITITSPSNFSEESSSDSSITVTGKANDTISGIQSIHVNGVNATVTGSSFSAQINLSYGLNKITATATSNSGATTSTQPIDIVRDQQVITSTGTATINPYPVQTVTVPSNNSAKLSSNKPAGRSKPKNSHISTTPVKVAGGVAMGAAGVGIASWLGFIPYKKIGILISKVIFK